jgi:hypothetical protein
MVTAHKKEVHDSSSDGCNRFSFYIDLSEVPEIKKNFLQLCVRYDNTSQDHWHNGDDMNYHFEFVTAIEGLRCQHPD